MLVIVDKRAPAAVKRNLCDYGELLELETSGITYPAISGHPDVFLTQINNILIVAPNFPSGLKKILLRHKVHTVAGLNPVGSRYPATAAYNAVIAGDTIVHNLRHTDPTILSHLSGGMRRISVKQGYTRCNLVFLNDRVAITSDRDIERNLPAAGIETLFVDPSGILLPGFRNGFFGGTCGIFNNELLIMGNLKHYPPGESIRKFAEKTGLKIIELYDGPLFDGGGIFFTGNLSRNDAAQHNLCDEKNIATFGNQD